MSATDPNRHCPTGLAFIAEGDVDPKIVCPEACVAGTGAADCYVARLAMQARPQPEGAIEVRVGGKA